MLHALMISLIDGHPFPSWINAHRVRARAFDPFGRESIIRLFLTA
jgi:hypothetical protein